MVYPRESVRFALLRSSAPAPVASLTLALGRENLTLVTPNTSTRKTAHNIAPVESVRLALLRSSASARAEVNAPCGWRSAPATHVAVHCANPRSEPFRRSFHRSTEAITSFRCGSVDDETKRELLLGEAPSSLSIGLSLAHGPLELLSSSIQPHATSLPALTTSLIINGASGDRTAQALSSAAQ